MDINKKLINCIIVKDLSRMGRNLIEIGKYLDDYLPKKNIRFIAVNDNYDSAKTEDDSYLCFFVERVIPSLLNWIDDTTNLINDYELVVSVEKEFGKEFCENFYEENHKSYVDQVYKTVGSIYEDETFENGIIDRSVTFDRVLIELKHGKTAYRKSKPNIIFGLLPNDIFSVNDHGVILIKTDDILANDWIVVD